MGLRRLFLKRPDLYERARELWPQHQQASHSHMAGPIRNLAYLLREAQLPWVDFDTVATRQDSKRKKTRGCKNPTVQYAQGVGWLWPGALGWSVLVEPSEA